MGGAICSSVFGHVSLLLKVGDITDFVFSFLSVLQMEMVSQIHDRFS
jgi:hypothetical protein